MKFIIAIILIIVSTHALASVATSRSNNLSIALSEAKTNQEPVLIYFTASWCGACKLMARTTLVDKDVVRDLSEVTYLTVDIDENQDLASTHSVQAVPTFQILSYAGNEVTRATGYQDAKSFRHWLKTSIAQVRETVVRQNRVTEQLRIVDQFISSNNEDSYLKAATILFEISAERDPEIVVSAQERLKKIASNRPLVLLNGLEHYRLATRILIANLLRELLGDRFDIDPWSDSVTRKNAVDHLRKNLAK